MLYRLRVVCPNNAASKDTGGIGRKYVQTYAVRNTERERNRNRK